MKKIILTTVAIVLSLSFSTLSAQSRRHHNDRRSHRIEQGSVEYLNSIPSVSVGVDFGGVLFGITLEFIIESMIDHAMKWYVHREG